MPDNKTVTFDADEYQLVPKVPTDEMASIFMYGGEYLGNRRGKPWVVGSEEWYGDREQFATDYAAMLSAAPTPAAQSAGQEAVELTDELVSATLKEYQLALQTDPRNTEQMRNSPTWPRVVDSMQKGAMREALTFALGRSAVPVNGGERERLRKLLNAAAGDGYVFDGVDAADLYVALFPHEYETVASQIASGSGFREHERAADAQQATAINAELLDLVKEARASMTAYLEDHSHNAPHDCYATGPTTGDEFHDLVRCPGCCAEKAFTLLVAKVDAALAKARGEA